MHRKSCDFIAYQQTCYIIIFIELCLYREWSLPVTINVCFLKYSSNHVNNTKYLFIVYQLWIGLVLYVKHGYEIVFVRNVCGFQYCIQCLRLIDNFPLYYYAINNKDIWTAEQWFTDNSSYNLPTLVTETSNRALTASSLYYCKQ